jgi:hypothetical protein
MTPGWIGVRLFFSSLMVIFNPHVFWAITSVNWVAHSRSFGLLVARGTDITTFFFNKGQSQKLLTDKCPLDSSTREFRDLELQLFVAICKEGNPLIATCN